MANSRFEYVKEFERENYLLKDTYILIRVDGRKFHKFSDHYEFQKPNDTRALSVMNEAARAIFNSFPDVMVGYGDSDEYSFMLRKDCMLFERRESKLVSTFSSTFTAFYIQIWPRYFDKPLEMSRLPTFDARAVVYPSEQSVRDYFSWRQADCHINNLYNTTFWNLVLSGQTPHEAEQELRGTLSADKNEILFSKFNINYNNEPEVFKKGTVIIRELNTTELQSKEPMTKRQLERLTKKNKMSVEVMHVDIIKDDFWVKHPYLLN